jgi:hypothetical protein
VKLSDIESSARVRADVSKVFGFGTLDIFPGALRYAKENGFGIPVGKK